MRFAIYFALLAVFGTAVQAAEAVLLSCKYQKTLDARTLLVHPSNGGFSASLSFLEVAGMTKLRMETTKKGPCAEYDGTADDATYDGRCISTLNNLNRVQPIEAAIKIDRTTGAFVEGLQIGLTNKINYGMCSPVSHAK